MSKIMYTTFIITLIVLINVVLFYAFEYYIQYKKDKEIINKTETTYKMLQDAYAKALESENFEWEEGKIDTEIFAKAIIKNLYVKSLLLCAFRRAKKCMPPSIKFSKLDETYKTNKSSLKEYYCIRLENGVGVGFKIESPTCDIIRGRCGNIYIDVNTGENPPNTLSEDIYSFGIYKDGIKLYDLEANHLPNCVYGTGFACASYMLKFKNRNYKSLTPKKAEKLGLKLTLPKKK